MALSSSVIIRKFVAPSLGTIDMTNLFNASVTALEGMSPQKDLFVDPMNIANADWNPLGLGSTINLNLVNQQTTRSGTLVAPRVAIGASHFPPAASGGIMYDQNTGLGVGYNVVSTYDVPGTDIHLMLLDTDLSSLGRPYQILNVSSPTNTRCVILDGEKKAFFGTMQNTVTDWTFTASGEPITGGDSGHPVFTTYEAPGGVHQPILMGCHYTTSGFKAAGNYSVEITEQCKTWGVQAPDFVSEYYQLEPQPA